jgi:phosphoribosylaminoimidazole (AIR) synthetase
LLLGQVNETEMLRTFNCGVGGVLIVSPEDKKYVMDALQKEDIREIGSVKSKSKYHNLKIFMLFITKILLIGCKIFYFLLS